MEEESATTTAHADAAVRERVSWDANVAMEMSSYHVTFWHCFLRSSSAGAACDGCSEFAAVITAAGSQFKLSGYWILTNLAAPLPKVHEEAFNGNGSINHPDLMCAVCQAERWPARLPSVLLALLSGPAFPMFLHQLVGIAGSPGEPAPLFAWLGVTGAAISAPHLQGCGMMFWTAKSRYSPKNPSLSTNTRDQNSQAFVKIPNFAYLILKHRLLSKLCSRQTHQVILPNLFLLTYVETINPESGGDTAVDNRIHKGRCTGIDPHKNVCVCLDKHTKITIKM